MDFKIDARLVGLRAIQEEIIDRAGWNATMGWKRRHAGASMCGMTVDLLRAVAARWLYILKVGPTPHLVRWELAKLRPAVTELVLLIYFFPVLFSLPEGKRMIRKRRIIRYNYGGYSKHRAAVAVTR